MPAAAGEAGGSVKARGESACRWGRPRAGEAILRSAELGRVLGLRAKSSWPPTGCETSPRLGMAGSVQNGLGVPVCGGDVARRHREKPRVRSCSCGVRPAQRLCSHRAGGHAGKPRPRAVAWACPGDPGGACMGVTTATCPGASCARAPLCGGASGSPAPRTTSGPCQLPTRWVPAADAPPSVLCPPCCQGPVWVTPPPADMSGWAVASSGAQPSPPATADSAPPHTGSAEPREPPAPPPRPFKTSVTGIPEPQVHRNRPLFPGRGEPRERDVCMCVCGVCACACVRAFVHACVCMHVHARVFVCMCAHVCMCLACMCACVCM